MDIKLPLDTTPHTISTHLVNQLSYRCILFPLLLIAMASRASNSTFGNFNAWERKEISRVLSLSDRDVLTQLRETMRGYDYSWHTISFRLRALLRCKAMRLEHFEPGNILYEWNVLCDEKLSWQRHGHPSFLNFRFNRICLIHLLIIPTQAGFGTQGKLFLKPHKIFI